MKSTRYKETEDQMSIKNYGGSNHKTEYDYDEKKWWDEIQTSNSHKQWTPKLKETSSPYATMCTPRLGVMMMMMMMMMMMWWDEMPLLLRHWYEIMALYYVKSILTEISASRRDRRVLQNQNNQNRNSEQMGHATDI